MDTVQIICSLMKNRRSVLIKLNDLRYLSYIFHMVENQLIKYTEAVPDVINYILQILDSASCGSSYHR